MASEVDTKIGSDAHHTAWCEAQGKRLVKSLRKDLGVVAWQLLGREMRLALVLAKVTGLILIQANEEAPLWRMQELVQVVSKTLEEGDQ